MKKYLINKTYEVIIEDSENKSEEEIKQYLKDTIRLIQRKEAKEVKDEPAEARGRLIARIFAKALKGECGPFGGENPYLRGNLLGLHSQAPVEWYRFNDDGSVDFENLEELIDQDPEFWAVEDEDDKLAVIDDIKHFNSINDLLHSNMSWVMDLDEDEILAQVDALFDEGEEVEDTFVEDVPVNAPEENVNITYTEKLKGGKNALTYGMIEEAFKNRGKDEGKTFKAYIKVVMESLKDDIANASDLVSGEMKETRKKLLEDYVKIERLVEKAGLEELAEMKSLIDELSDKLNLNYWKQPKFKKKEQRQASKELRNLHRWDSKISKSLKPVFLCTKAELTSSYNDAKQGKLPEVFEANLEKVRKDMTADYDRINHGRDTYLEDPRISKTIPEIIDLYDTALKYADDLEYSDYAREFAFMLDTIKKGWAI